MSGNRHGTVRVHDRRRVDAMDRLEVVRAPEVPHPMTEVPASLVPGLPEPRWPGAVVAVDTALLPLVRHLWRLGLNTRYSCQGHALATNPDVVGWSTVRAYVAFEMPEEALGASVALGLRIREQDVYAFDADGANTEGNILTPERAVLDPRAYVEVGAPSEWWTHGPSVLRWAAEHTLAAYEHVRRVRW